MSVSLGELNANLKPNARVIVWGRYAQMLGLAGKKIDAKPDALVAAVAGGRSEVELQDFDCGTAEGRLAEFNRRAVEGSGDAEKPDLVQKVSVELENFE